MITTTNSTCYECKKRFNDCNNKISVLNCGHIIHDICTKSNLVYCKLCKNYFNIETDENIPNQKKIDIHSLSVSTWKPKLKDYCKLFVRVPLIMLCCVNLFFDWMTLKVLKKTNMIDDEHLEKFKKHMHFRFFNYAKYIFNINAKWYGFDNYNIEEKKILISNHVSYYDIFVIGTKIKCGAVMSSSVNNIIAQIMHDITECIIINRGEKNQTVDKIENHVNKYGEIFVCPQGIFSHYQTISQFRTGAFCTKYNVQPIILKYKQNVSSMTMLNMLLHDSIDVDVIVMKPILKPQNINSLDYAKFVLKSMIDESGFLMSNVTSHDVKD